MPRAKKVCSHYSCPNIMPCALHERQPWEGSTRKDRVGSGWKQQKRRRYMLQKFNLTCASCGEVRLACDLEVDHVVNLAEGGPDTTANCQLLCRACHSLKSQAEARRGRQVGE